MLYMLQQLKLTVRVYVHFISGEISITSILKLSIFTSNQRFQFNCAIVTDVTKKSINHMCSVLSLHREMNGGPEGQQNTNIQKAHDFTKHHNI